MTSAPRLSDRVGRLRQLQAARGLGALAHAAALPGDWPPGCEAYPASFAQARLWFLHQLEPELTAYHLPMVWTLRGDLDGAALQRALEGLIERHPTLRTAFRLQESEVLQILHPATPVALRAEALGERDPDAVIQQWLDDENRTPFDLTAGRLLRARLLEVDGQEHRLLINHHHIASDGWSRSVLVRDLVELYNAERIGRDPSLPPLAIHYQHYAVWQRQRLSGERLQTLGDYWIGQLSDLEPLQLPSDHPRPAMPSYRGESVCFQVAPSLLGPFEQLCRSEGATLQMGVLALVALLLHRYSRQDDLAIGVPIWGRNHPELENLIGFFINTLPIRTRFKPEQSFRELLVQVRDTSIGAYDHQELPFEQIVEALNLPRDTSRNPLVQVMLQLIEWPEPSPEAVEGLHAEPLPDRQERVRFDLEFLLRRSPSGGLRVQILYAADLFHGDRIERLSSHLLTLLSSAVQTPDSPAGALDLLPDRERLLIQSWQQGPRLAVPQLCVHQLLEQQVERTPDAIALVFGDQKLTYSELNQRANRLAHHLIARGVGSERIVALALERSIELVVALLAILKAGGAYLPLDPAWPSRRLAQILEDAAPALVITSRPSVAAIQACGVITADALLTIPIGAGDAPEGHGMASASPPDRQGFDPAANPGRPQDPATAAYLLYTSGTTGTPKGVNIEHGALVARTTDLLGRLRLDPSAVVLAHTALSFDISIVEVLMPLAGGARVVLSTEEQQRDPAALIQLVNDQRITLLQATPSQWEVLLRSGYNNQPQILAIAGGEALPPALAEAIRQQSGALINGYGPTEVTIYASMQTVEAGSAVGIGKPLANTAALVLDRHGHPCPIGIAGELFLGGCGVARGYRNRAELTRERFVSMPLPADRSAGEAATRLYATGDLAHWNPDGTLSYRGRLDQQIKLRGFRIEPGEIASHLLAHPGVAQAVVVLRHDDPANPRLIAYWVPKEPSRSAATREGGAPGAEHLRQALKERLPESMVPAAFVALEALPLTANGKLDRNALPAPSFSGDQEQRVEPSSERERQLHGLWAEVLGHGEFGITDNFFLVGGHSLAAARLVARLQQDSGRAVPITSLFQNPTIAALAALLDAWSSSPSGQEAGHRSGAGPATDRGSPATASAAPAAASAAAAAEAAVTGKPASALVPLQPRGEGPSLFVVHGWGGHVFAHIGLAQALVPHRRAVHGLQAIGFDGSQPRQLSVEAMAALYAAEIRRFQPEGPYHLLGFSAGSWYAWAVAAELQRTGASIGLVGLIDPGPSSRLHKRLLLRHPPLLVRQWSFRLNLSGWWLRGAVNAAARRAWGLLQSGESRQPEARPQARQTAAELGSTASGIATSAERPAGGGRSTPPDPAPASAAAAATADRDTTAAITAAADRWRIFDYYVDRQNAYRPPRLPLQVNVFCTHDSVARQQMLWRFYSAPEPVIEPFIGDHHDYLRHGDAARPFAERLQGLMVEREAAEQRGRSRAA